eukprot:scaffold64635_cov66-Phaeocystis_antarctica.AAC.6
MRAARHRAHPRECGDHRHHRDLRLRSVRVQRKGLVRLCARASRAANDQLDRELGGGRTTEQESGAEDQPGLREGEGQAEHAASDDRADKPEDRRL